MSEDFTELDRIRGVAAQAFLRAQDRLTGEFDQQTVAAEETRAGFTVEVIITVTPS